MRILVIGGGASGMIAALSAAECETHQVTILERQSRVGRKLAATGNGRCNLTNRNACLSHYHGESPEFVSHALNSFSVEDTLRWFRGIGLFTTTEPSGRVYPFSDQAGSVVDVLRLAIEQSRNIHLETGCEVLNLHWSDDCFFIDTDARRYAADRVIIACGGMAGGKVGGTMSGYQFLKSFGHSCTKLYPALVQLKTDPTWVRSLKGIRTNAVIHLTDASGSVLIENRGEVQFTEYGVSGPAIFEISRWASSGSQDLTVELDLLPPMDPAELEASLHEKAERFPSLTLENYLTGLLQNRLGRTLLRYCGLSLEATASSLRKRDIRAIAAAVKHFVLPVLGTTGMDQAQVTAGGIRTSEFDPRTMESTLQPGLFACGEVLDIDGDCGGFNLQWAWSSGRLAGLSAAR